MSEIEQVRDPTASRDDTKASPSVEATSQPADLSQLDPKERRIRQNLEEFERLFGVDEDAYEQPTTTRKELWSYYLYYNGILLNIIQRSLLSLTDLSR